MTVDEELLQFFQEFLAKVVNAFYVGTRNEAPLKNLKLNGG